MADHQPAPRMQPAPRINGQPDRGGVNANGISSEAIRARQKMLVEQGYNLTVDGLDGEATQKAYRDWQGKQAERAASEQRRLEREAEATREAQRNAAAVERSNADAESKRADAETKAAEARAAEAAARAKEAEAAAAVTRAKADADKRQADADRSMFSTPLLAAAAVGGSIYGSRNAGKLKAEYDANVAAQNAKLATSAKTIEALVSKAERQKGPARSATLQKIAGHVSAVDQKRLAHAPSGIKGAAAAALPLLVESSVARVLGATMEEGYTKDVVNEISTGLGLAGSVLFGSRYTSIKNAGDPIDAHAVGTVNSGRNIAKRQLAPPQPKAPPAVAARPAPAAIVVPPIIAAGQAANQNVLAAQAKGLGGKLGKGLGAIGLIAGLASLVQTARAHGVADAAKEAAQAVDPTGGTIERLVEKANDAGAGSLRDLAKSQADDRKMASELDVSAQIAREAALMQRTGADPETLGVSSGAAGIARAIVLGNLQGAQAEQAMRTMEAGGGALAKFYAGSMIPEIVARGEQAKIAGDFAREANSRSPAPTGPTVARTVPAPQQPTPYSGPRGWADPRVQHAAQEARRRKGIT